MENDEQKRSKLEDWKSRKLWFHIAGFVSGLVLATYGLLTPTAAGFIVTMAVSYGASNAVAKKFASQRPNSGPRLTGYSRQGGQ